MIATDPICCPRCGYDLSGAHAASAGALAGTCSECGLNFAWSDVLSGHLHTPAFSYEHGPWYDARRFIATAARAALGVPLWRKLRMVHPIVPGRLVVFALAIVASCHVLAVALVLVALRYGVLVDWTPPPYTAAMSRWAATPPPGVPFFSRQFQVHASDLVQLAVCPYGTTPQFPLASGARIGVTLSLDGTLAVVLTALGPALLLVGLRQTRRQFRLRKLHLLRSALLGVPFAIASFLTMDAVAGAFVLAGAVSAWDQNGRLILGLIGAATLLIVQTLWWWSFTRCYLRAPHALGIACAGELLGGLLTIGLALATGSRLLHDIIS